MSKILLTQIHIIRKNHRLYKYCDDICFRSKNLYNRTNYLLREEFINNGKIIFSNELNKQMKNEDCFKALPAKTSQLIIIQLGNSWKSFFKGIKDWKNNKSKYCGMPKLPKYKAKNGRNIVLFDYMQGSFRDGKYYFPNRERQKREYIETNIEKKNFKLLRIVPYGNCYKIEIVYEKEYDEKINFNDNYLGIDLGVNNFATLVNNIGLQSIVINGRILKSINQYYNKFNAQAMSYIGKGSSNRIQRLATKRNNIFNTYLHRMSHWTINYCLENNIGNIVIGRNKDWQRNVNIGRKNNQEFAQIPFEKFINQLIYKGKLSGINIQVIDEYHTSRASFLDQDIIIDKQENQIFSGKRKSRGLYKSKKNVIINADVNAAYNILQKCNPEVSWNNGIEGVSLHPVRVNI